MCRFKREMALAKHTTIITKHNSPEGGIKARAHVEVQVSMNQNARGSGLFLGKGGGGGGIRLTRLIPDSLLRETVRANCPRGD